MTYDITWKQILGLFVLAIPIACVARTIILEEIFRETRDWCKRRSQACGHVLERKFYYLLTCEYCFSHYVTAAFLIITRFKLMFDDWRGYLISFFSLIFVANLYLNLYSRLRVDITSQKKEIEAKEKEIQASDLDLAAREKELGAIAGGPKGASDGDKKR